MKKAIVLSLIFLIPLILLPHCRRAGERGQEETRRDYPVQPVPFTRVELADKFWAPRLEITRTKSVRYAFQMNEETGRVDNFRKAARLMSGPHTGKRYNDSDVFKAMEAACYALLLHPDPELEKKVDELVDLIGKAQEPDGYLYTAMTIDPENPAPGAGDARWSNLRVSHELYNVGHMYEAAVAHFQATGRRTFLDIAEKNAGLLLRTFGPGLRRGFPGHQEIEIGLARLYRVSGKKEYLDLARFFLDERGYYHQGMRYSESDPFSVYNSDEYLQNHKPVLEQDEAAGHAVRATYMYAGMADVAALGGYPEYVSAIDRLWENVVGRKMYLTGGLGSRHTTEGFGDAYELPSAEAYAETCAAVGHAFWNHRLFLLHGEARYIDVFERVLYNGLLSGVSLSGDRFFYQNPLESPGDYERSPWFAVACCPANISRFLPSLPGYVYAVSGGTIYVNLFIASDSSIALDSQEIRLKQETEYPWDGNIKLLVDVDEPTDFTLAVRIPGWARGEAVPSDLYRYLDRAEEKPALHINGEEQARELTSGYAFLRRTWRKGDAVELVLPMPVRRVIAHEAVEACRGRVALERGPIVYCAEGVDNGGPVRDFVIPDGASFKTHFRPDLLGGVAVISGKAKRAISHPGGRRILREEEVTLIPYYAWANRGPSAMSVWVARTPDALK